MSPAAQGGSAGLPSFGIKAIPQRGRAACRPAGWGSRCHRALLLLSGSGQERSAGLRLIRVGNLAIFKQNVINRLQKKKAFRLQRAHLGADKGSSPASSFAPRFRAPSLRPHFFQTADQWGDPGVGNGCWVRARPCCCSRVGAGVWRRAVQRGAALWDAAAPWAHGSAPPARPGGVSSRAPGDAQLLPPASLLFLTPEPSASVPAL